MPSTDRKRGIIHTLLFLAILVAGIFTPIAFAAPLDTSDKDWQYVNGNSWGWNYSPETQITKSNVKNLEVKWVFSLGSKALAPAGLQSVPLTEGSSAPPIVRNGIVYITTNFLKTYAIDAKTGRQIWTHDYNADLNDIHKKLPMDVTGPRVGGAHLHAFRYWEGGDAVLLYGMACDFYGLDAKTGREKIHVYDLCKNVPGNVYMYQFGGIESLNGANNIATYEKGRQFIFVLSSSSITRIPIPASRHVTMGIDMNSSKILWRVFSQPPSDKLSKDWDLQECSIGYFQTYPCTEVAAKNPAGLEWDWAFPNEGPSRWGGVSANWGQPVVDEETGILYTQTGNQSPYGNMSMTPGPRLYGSTIMAIDMNIGKRKWWLQPFPRDPYDFDCNWGGILAEVNGLGKVYMKGCKEGRLYVMDAATGKPHYVVDVIKEQVAWGQVTSAALKEPPQGGVRYHLTNPFNYSDLREWRSIADGRYCKPPCNVYPHFYNGLFGIDMSYDPTTQTLYHYAAGLQVVVIHESPYVEGQLLVDIRILPETNTTVVARDAATGKVKWTYFYPYGMQRSAMVATPEMVFTGFTDGYMRFFDKVNGKMLREVNLGSEITVSVTTGQDSAGDQKIFAMLGTRVNNVPGSLVALGLTEKTISTTVKTTTTTTTVTVTTGSANQAETVPAEIAYASVAVAVIAVIAAVILVARRQR
ncbi:MAG: PQQ-binding-like beta-propeller repeat protein [Thaumarchaeota archaeon]|nr:PQQ-binding-like beta-propeller repeat protein [Nitrososphaerota archaeon]